MLVCVRVTKRVRERERERDSKSEIAREIHKQVHFKASQKKLSLLYSAAVRVRFNHFANISSARYVLSVCRINERCELHPVPSVTICRLLQMRAEQIACSSFYIWRKTNT